MLTTSSDLTSSHLYQEAVAGAGALGLRRSYTGIPWGIAGLVPECCNTVLHLSLNHFSGGGFCFQFVKNGTPAKHNKTRDACIMFAMSLYSVKRLCVLF